MTIWLDVEDLYEYAVASGRPSGIQRLSFEIYQALVALAGENEVRFCRHHPRKNELTVVAWAEVRELYLRIARPAPLPEAEDAAPSAPPPNGEPTTEEPPPVDLPPQIDGPTPLRSTGARSALARILPIKVRALISQALAHQVLAVKYAIRCSGYLIQDATISAARRATRLIKRNVQWTTLRSKSYVYVTDFIKDEDRLIILGSPWDRNKYRDIVRKLKSRHNIKFCLFIHDIIPIIHPEWCTQHLTEVFRRWHVKIIPEVDCFFANSRSTARDLTAWIAAERLAPQRNVSVIPVGAGFSNDAQELVEPPLPSGLAKGGFVLVVSTIEARKNHILAFRIWRRLLDLMEPDAVPTLVFAGRVGWLVADLIQQIENSDQLAGKLVVLNEVDDALLTALYRNCRFTLFPSLYEGWGLPVTESLSHGKVCVASNRAAIPEAGGEFCLYFDPDNLNDATEIVRSAILNPDLILERQRRISSDYRATSWTESAQALLTAAYGED